MQNNPWTLKKKETEGLIWSSVAVHEYLNNQHVSVCVCCCAFKNTCGLWVKENLGVATQQICIGEKKNINTRSESKLGRLFLGWEVQILPSQDLSLSLAGSMFRVDRMCLDSRHG